MRSGAAPVQGLMTIRVHKNGNVYVRYGEAYDSYDPDHKHNYWIKKIAYSLQTAAKKFIIDHQ